MAEGVGVPRTGTLAVRAGGMVLLAAGEAVAWEGEAGVNSRQAASNSSANRVTRAASLMRWDLEGVRQGIRALSPHGFRRCPLPGCRAPG